MTTYILRRLLLLPLTLFVILFVNFIIINLAPGDPIMVAQVSDKGEAARNSDDSASFGSDEQYLQFRERYGLTLPVIINLWPNTSLASLKKWLQQLITRTEEGQEMSAKAYDDLRINVGDRARFIMPLLITLMNDPQAEPTLRIMAARFFIRGGTEQAFVGPDLSPAQKLFNRQAASSNATLLSQMPRSEDSWESTTQKIAALSAWYHTNESRYLFDTPQKLKICFLETRFVRYFTRVLTLDFGTLRNDANRTVIHEVAKRLKYSLTLSLIPMLLTFLFCQLFGFLMALYHNRTPDLLINLLCLALYAIPIFVVAPFLIEKVAITHALPYSGFHSPDALYNQMTSAQRLVDTLTHIMLPILAVLYGSLAAQSRLSRTAVLEVLRQDYVRTARAKGLPRFLILWKHVGRNAAITIVTALAASLGVLLGGSLIVETIFEINGFGKFFYEAILNRDYNVIMFSSLTGAALALLSYLLADITYTLLDPRVSLD